MPNSNLTPEVARFSLSAATSRRTLLKWTGAGIVGGLALTVGVPSLGSYSAFAADAVDLGTGDVGVLNYAYALEQLEAAFYTMVVANPFTSMSADDKAVLTDIRDHEVAHRDFLKSALASAAIPDLAVDFSKIDFTSRMSVLGTARTFEDLGVSAYNGAGRLLTDAGHLLAAGRIVSVEARHAAVIRDMLVPNTTAFAGDDVVDKNGLDGARTPDKVLAAAGPFVKTKITVASTL